MTQQRPPAARPRDGATETGGQGPAALPRNGVRLVLTGCLLALVAAGLRAAVPAPRLDGPFRHDGLLIGAILEAVLACLAMALWVRHRRAQRGDLLAARLRRVLGYVIGAGLITIPVLYLLSRAQRQPAPRPQTVHPTAAPATPTPTPQVHRVNPATPAAQVIVLALLILLAAVLIFLAAWFLWRHRGSLRSGWPGKARGFPVPITAEDDEPGLREAVESGYSALRGLDDARAAIIACYLAMEDSARAGTPRGAADTPDELLARAVARGLVHGGAAARMTELFYEARFSSHPMLPADRDDAEGALAELAASLGDLAAASAAPGPGPDGAGQ
jgi:hypothetical protein